MEDVGEGVLGQVRSGSQQSDRIDHYSTIAPWPQSGQVGAPAKKERVFGNGGLRAKIPYAEGDSDPAQVTLPDHICSKGRIRSN